MTKEPAAALYHRPTDLTRGETGCPADTPGTANDEAVFLWSDDADRDPVCTPEFASHSRLLDTRLRA